MVFAVWDNVEPKLSPTELVFSLEDMKRRAYNALLAQVILSNLDLSARFEELANSPFSPLDFGLKAA
ncbi:hypothetical protein A2G07_15045 (plasmid) [Deinococcus radiodurans R1 = ATCC 13939 = DSM 20539]|nr:transposase [Deinococcus radiodurans]pir/B75624/ transposase, pseudogene - Deinococcus radiodurans (strain R1) [Deinococcus radiodurans]ANC73178.1 hypothetical protein A2G07_15045 [Deinococcus radiodurans R1 = ATCC 13939 = DSM 20539]